MNLLGSSVLQGVVLFPHAELALIAALVDAWAFGGRPEIRCASWEGVSSAVASMDCLVL